MKKVINSKQVNTRLPIHMVQQIKYIAQENGITDGSIIEAALRDYLGKTEHEDVLINKVDKLSRQIEKLRRENGLMLEVVSSFIRVYLTHTQEIPEQEKLNAELRGAKKFSRFMDLVASSLDQNKPFFDELEQKRFEKEDFTQ
jgi:predicted DNA-binding protein